MTDTAAAIDVMHAMAPKRGGLTGTLDQLPSVAPSLPPVLADHIGPRSHLIDHLHLAPRRQRRHRRASRVGLLPCGKAAAADEVGGLPRADGGHRRAGGLDQ